MKQFVVWLMIAGSFSLSAPRAQAITPTTSSTLIALGVTAVAVYLVGSSPPSIAASSQNKQMAKFIAIEDVAAYVMDEGKTPPSDLLRSLMDSMRNDPEFSRVEEEVTDMDLARALLDHFESELD